MNKKPTAAGSTPYALKRVPLIALAFCAPFCQAGEGGEVTEPPPRETTVETRPLPEGVPALQMSTEYAHPALGFGTYAPIGQVTARAIRVAPFTVRAGVQTGAGFDDNVGLTRSNKVSSMFFTVAPSIAVGLEGATQRYYAIYRGNYGVYSSSSQDNYDDHNIALSAANSWTARFRSLVNYEYLRGHNARGITVSSATSGPEEWTSQSVRGSASYGAAGATARVDGNVGYATRRYSSGGTVAATADYDQLTAGGTFTYRLAPRTRALVQATWSEFEHSGDPSLDNTEMRYLVGVTWEALAKTTGRFTVGYTTKDFPDPSRADFSGQSYDAGVTWTPQPYSIFDFSLGRFLSESYEAGSNLVVNTVGTAVWNHLWPRGIRSTLNYIYGQTRHEGLSRTDTYQTWAARVSYGIRPQVRVGAEVRHEARDSDSSGIDYTRNIILLTLEAAL
jgi:hypothetical protein